MNDQIYEAQALEIAKLAADLKSTKAENDRLRELVQSMYGDLSHETFPPDWLAEYEADMRELGIEAG